jgi:hypothetical protein
VDWSQGLGTSSAGHSVSICILKRLDIVAVWSARSPRWRRTITCICQKIQYGQNLKAGHWFDLISPS